MAALAAGVSPLLIRPQYLVSYLPLLGRATDEEDWVRGGVWTNNNSATVGDSGAIVGPRRQSIFLPAAVGNTILVPAGSLALTAKVPTVSLTANQTIAVPAGGLVLTGQVPTIVNPQGVTVPAGSVVLSAFAPTILNDASNVIQVPVGALALTAKVPTVVQTGNQTITQPNRLYNDVD
jgi:hypothetical protein